MKILFFMIILLGISFPSFSAEKYICQVNVKKYCNQKTCKNMVIPNDDYRIIDIVAETYAIGTDIFKLEDVNSAGMFTIFKVGGAGYMKMNWMNKDSITNLEIGQFMEVRDTFLTSIISYGVCKF